MPPDIGALAPPLELPTATGETRSLQDFRGKPVILSFLGPAHCSICRGHVIKVIQAREDIARLGAEVVLVAHHDPELLTSKMLRDLDMPFLLLLDPKRESYRRWGMGRVSLRSYFVPGLYWALIKAMLTQPFLGTSPQYNQLGGDFVVDPGGRLAFVNRMRSLHDRAPVRDLLAVLQRA